MDQAPDTESVAAAASPACELKNKDIESSAVGVSKSKADEPLFQLKKWNGVAMWSWDVTTESCAICRINLLGERFLQATCTLKHLYLNAGYNYCGKPVRLQPAK